MGYVVCCQHESRRMAKVHSLDCKFAKDALQGMTSATSSWLGLEEGGYPSVEAASHAYEQWTEQVWPAIYPNRKRGRLQTQCNWCVGRPGVLALSVF